MKARNFWIGSLVVLLLAAAVTITLAEETVTYYACVNNESGTIKIVEEDQECHKNETLISWNQRGPKGDQGAPGPEGPQGPPGPQGVQGEPGPQGEPGEPGPKGDPGEQGPRGETGQDGADGLACWDLNGDGVGTVEEDTNRDGVYNAADCQGPKGDQGVPGPEGPQGVQGEPGPQGEPGEPGLKGDPGEPGQDGADGLACWDLNGNALPDPAEDINGDSSWDTLDCQGPEGLQGEPGPEGPRGAEGPPGPAQASPYTPYPGDLEIFFKIEGVNGSSQDPAFSTWSEALGYRFQARMNPAPAGGGPGTLLFGNFQVIKPFDAATEIITAYASNASVISKIEIEVCRPNVGHNRQCFLHVLLQNTVIENYELRDIPPHGQLEVIGIDFDSITMTYTAFDQTGNDCGPKYVTWNILNNTGNAVTGVDPNCRIGYGDGDGKTYLESTALSGPLSPANTTITDVIGLTGFDLDILYEYGGSPGIGTGTIETGVSLTKGTDQSSPEWFYKLVSGTLVPNGYVYYCGHGSCPYRHALQSFSITEMTFSEYQVEEIILQPGAVSFETAPY